MKSLTLEVKRQRNVHCEVVAYSFGKKDKGPSVHKSCSGHSSLLGQLKRAEELPQGSGSVLVRFKGRYGGKHVLFINLGENAKGIDALAATERLRRLGALVSQKLMAEKISSAVVLYDSFLPLATEEESLDPRLAAQSLIEGLYLACYKFDKYHSKKSTSAGLEKIFVSSKSDKDMADLKTAAKTAKIIGDAVFLARDLGNEPSNELNPAAWADFAKKVAKQNGLKCTVFDEKKILQEKMLLLNAVGKGSAFPPRFIILEWSHPKPKTHLALVGKGMTFDSGGISIKPSARMEEMKLDMCGGAAIMGAAVAIAQLKLPVKLTAVIAAAENMPSGSATNPGNIVKSRSGKTVDIVNTDAEGRLILADALDWVQTERKPDYIIDAATLTGAVGVALGKVCAGLMGNDDDLNLTICEASENSGERVWELPTYKEYFDDLAGGYADMKNVGDGPYGGCQRGGMFIKQFIREGNRWAHIDLAAMAWDHGAIVPYSPRKGASGWGVRLLLDTAMLLGSEYEE
jgi:leucyl aminopeptidase